MVIVRVRRTRRCSRAPGGLARALVVWYDTRPYRCGA
jgi:hypothetical protein